MPFAEGMLLKTHIKALTVMNFVEINLLFLWKATQILAIFKWLSKIGNESLTVWTCQITNPKCRTLIFSFDLNVQCPVCWLSQFVCLFFEHGHKSLSKLLRRKYAGSSQNLSSQSWCAGVHVFTPSSAAREKRGLNVALSESWFVCRLCPFRITSSRVPFSHYLHQQLTTWRQCATCNVHAWTPCNDFQFLDPVTSCLSIDEWCLLRLQFLFLTWWASRRALLRRVYEAKCASFTSERNTLETNQK